MSRRLAPPRRASQPHPTPARPRVPPLLLALLLLVAASALALVALVLFLPPVVESLEAVRASPGSAARGFVARLLSGGFR
jgi:hypothetical protein